METVDITVRVKKEQHDWLKSQSEERQRSIASVLRLILDDTIQAHKIPDSERLKS